MYMSLWTGELKPGMLEEVARVNETQIRSVVPKVTGLIKLVTGLDRNTNKVVTVVLWNSAEDAAAGRDSTEFKAAFAELAKQYTKAPSREAFEVILDI